MAECRDARANAWGRRRQTRWRPRTILAALIDAPRGSIRHTGPLAVPGADQDRKV